MDLERSLVLLPGLGADERLFAPQSKAFPHLHVPSWLRPNQGESLASYGQRMADGIDGAKPFYLGGVSFGGVVALEMATHLSPLAVILIGSCTSARSIPTYARALGFLARGLPSRMFQVPRIAMDFLAYRFGAVNAAQRELLFQMMKVTPPSFIKWGCSAIMKWTYAGTAKMPVHHIHGSADKIIPADLVKADVIVEGAGHLVNLTHPQEVNSFLRRHMA